MHLIHKIDSCRLQETIPVDYKKRCFSLQIQSPKALGIDPQTLWGLVEVANPESLWGLVEGTNPQSVSGSIPTAFGGHSQRLWGLISKHPTNPFVGPRSLGMERQSADF